MSDNRKCEAMILAAGLGKRMRSYNSCLPKPMIKVGGKPLIDYSLALLHNVGISRIVVNTHYKAQLIEQHLATKTDFIITISKEKELLETGGGIKQALPLLADSFFVLNSDVICLDSAPPVLQQMQNFWQPDKMDALLLLVHVDKAVGYKGAGDFTLSEQNNLQHVSASRQHNYVYTGVQLLHKRFLVGAYPDKFSLSIIYKQYLANGSKRIFGLVHEGDWFHVGDSEAVAMADTQLQLCCG